MSIYQDIQSIREELHLTLELSEKQGEKWAVAKARYETVKSRAVLDLKSGGYAATIIEQIIKGVPDVNDAYMEMLTAEVQYKNTCEAINVLKKDYDFLREQYQREWSQSGWSER